MLKNLLLFTLFGSSSLYAKDIQAKKAVAVDGYIFVESAIQPNLLLILGKTETIIVSQSENTTTTGIPIKSYVLQTRWINDGDGRRAALEKALAKYPEWGSFAKDREDIASSYCRFKLIDSDVKVGPGGRETSLSSNANLCEFVVHTKASGDQKLLDGIKNNSLIDSGLGIYTVITGSQKVLFDAKPISDQVEKILAKDVGKVISGREAAFCLGVAFVKYDPDEFVLNPDDLFAPENQQELLAAMAETFDLVYAVFPANSKTFKFKGLNAATPVFSISKNEITFDPQK